MFLNSNGQPLYSRTECKPYKYKGYSGNSACDRYMFRLRKYFGIYKGINHRSLLPHNFFNGDKVTEQTKLIQIDSLIKNENILKHLGVNQTNELIVLKTLPKFITPGKIRRASAHFNIDRSINGVVIKGIRHIDYMSISKKDEPLTDKTGINFCEIMYYDPYEISSLEYFVVRRKDLLRFYKVLKTHRDIKKPNLSQYYTQNLIFDQALESKIVNYTEGVLNSHKILKEYSVRLNIGIILRGNPGNGKTSLVTKIVSKIKNCQVKFFNSSTPISEVSKFRTQCVMSGMNNIIVFDDVDINLFNRGKSQQSNDFLSILDGPEDKGNQKSISITIFTTNESLENMDSAFLRPGRIDYVFEIKNPTQDDREVFLGKFHKDILDFLHENRENALTIAKKTEDFSFAMLEGIKSRVVNHMIFNKDTPLDVDSIIKEISTTFNNKKSKRVGL